MKTIIVKPLISEKSLREAQAGRYTFKVAKDADKQEVRKEIEQLFKVKVIKVATNIVKGTKTRFARRGKSVSDLTYKKARVQLKKGDKIEIFEEKTK